MSVLDPKWKYTPSGSTDIRSTLKKHGFKPTTDAERKARQHKKSFMLNMDPVPSPTNIVVLGRIKL